MMLTTTMTFLALAGAALLAAATLVTLVRASGSAAMRHLLWTAVLSMLVMAPLLELSGLRIEVPVPEAWVVARATESTPSAERPSAAPREGVAATTVTGPSKGVAVSVSATRASSETASATAMASETAAATPMASATASRTPMSSEARVPVTVPATVATVESKESVAEARPAAAG